MFYFKRPTYLYTRVLRPEIELMVGEKFICSGGICLRIQDNAFANFTCGSMHTIIDAPYFHFAIDEHTPSM